MYSPNFHTNNLDERVFQDEYDRNAFVEMLEKLDHVQAIFVRRDSYEKRKHNPLKKNSRDFSCTNTRELLSIMNDKVKTIVNLEKNWEYNLYLPYDLKYGELLQYIDILSKEFGIEAYSKMNELISYVKVMASGIIKNLGKNEGEKYIEEIISTYNLSKELVEQITNHSTPIFQAKKIISDIKSQRHLNNQQEKFAQESTDILLGFHSFENLLGEEFDLSFFRRGINVVRLGMNIITQSEVEEILIGNGQQEIGKKKLPNNIEFKDGKIVHRVEDEEMEKEEKKLREAIDIDKLKKILDNIRKNGTQEEIEKKEYEAASKILTELLKFPYQNTATNYGYQLSKMIKHKETQCVGFSLLGHAFLSELGIKHKGLTLPGHSAIEINIGKKQYYFDGAWEYGKLAEFTYGVPEGVYKKIIFKKDISLSGKNIYAIPGKTEKALLTHILRNSSADIKPMNLEEKIHLLEKALKLSPQDPEIHNDLGIRYGQMRNKSKSLFHQRKAMRLGGDMPQYSLSLGVSLDDSKYFKEAEIKAKKMISKDPGNVKWLEVLGKSLMMQWKTDKAEIIFEEALQENPSSENHLFLGNILIIQGNYEEALELYMKTSEKIPEDSIKELESYIDNLIATHSSEADLYKQKGQIFKLKNKHDEAIEYFEEAIALEEKNPLYHIEIGYTFLENGDYEDAIYHLERALKLGEWSEKIHYYLGECFNYTGRKMDAVIQFTKASNINPYNSLYLRRINVLLLNMSSRNRKKAIKKRDELPEELEHRN